MKAIEPLMTETRGPSPDVIEVLMREHQRFAKLLGLLEAEVRRFGKGAEPDYELLQDIFFYMTKYPDRFHHPIEDLAFAEIAQRAPAARRHVEELRRQHRMIADRGTQFIERLERALGGGIVRREAIEAPALDYIALYREHMALEAKELFPLGRTHLQATDWERFRATIKPEDDPVFGHALAEEYRNLHRQIAAWADCGCAPQ